MGEFVKESCLTDKVSNYCTLASLINDVTFYRVLLIPDC